MQDGEQFNGFGDILIRLVLLIEYFKQQSIENNVTDTQVHMSSNKNNAVWS